MGALKVQVFSSIEEMKNISDYQQLSDEQALEKTLDMMDLYASLRNGVEVSSSESSEIEWTVLRMKKCG